MFIVFINEDSIVSLCTSSGHCRTVDKGHPNTSKVDEQGGTTHKKFGSRSGFGLD